MSAIATPDRNGAREPMRLAPVPNHAATEFGADLLACLRDEPHAIAPKYFYDERGSRLFERICALPEYYLTRAELAIFATHVGEMAALIGADAQIVEFGAGALTKTRLLLDALPAPRSLAAIDISGRHLECAVATLRCEYPRIEVTPVVADFTRIETLPVWRGGGRRIGFFPGSTLGNLLPAEAERFLSGAARLLKGGGLLIGVDLVKDPAILHAAYNDAAGVTADFNRNLLARANRELGGNFDTRAFAHYAHYNAASQRVEMHLIGLGTQRISLLGQSFVLHEGEALRTETSQKYTVEGFQALAVKCGFQPRAVWRDPGRLFSVHWLAADG